MKTKTIQITEISIDELSDIIAEKLVLKIEDYLKKISTKKNDELLTRHQASEYLKVSLVTLNIWSKTNILKSRRIGNRVFYKKQDILDILDKK